MAKRYMEDDIKLHTDFDEPIVIDDNAEYREKFLLFLKTVNVNAKDIHDKQTRKHLITMCMEYYRDNENEKSFMKNFSQSYKPEEAISWYMRGSCLHRLLSRAFIDQDMSVLVDMHSFIVDINRHILTQGIKQSSPIRVFRGQFLSNERLNQLKDNINQTVTMQCFLSAQTSRDEALHLLQSIEPIDTTFKRILFEIDVIQDYYSASKTVLLTLGAVFKIIDATESTVVLSQCVSHLNDNHELANESPLILRGILTYLKDGTSEGIKYFEQILRNPSQTDIALHSSVYGQLGYLRQKSGDLGVATKMYEQVMHNGTMQFGLYLFYLERAAQYHAVVLGDWEKAMNIWIQKLNIQNAFLSNEEKVQTYENLARAALQTKHYDKTIEYTLAAIENLPNDHPRLPFLQQQLEINRKNLSE